MQPAQFVAPPAGLLYLIQYPIFATSPGNALPYSQPHAVELLVLLSFLFFLNASRVVADYLLHAGIIAEIGLGVVYGAPLAGILPKIWEHTFTALGYLGLIGIVFEGGLSTDLHTLLGNLPLSATCAFVGVALPLALSFALLQAGFGYQPLEAFAAGTALSSTSLGTTLMALSSISRRRQAVAVAPDRDEKRESENQHAVTVSSDVKTVPSDADEVQPLHRSRIGTILVSAAVIDDVLGLVLASLIPALSAINTDSTQRPRLAWTIIRPLLSSCLMALVTPPVARFILRPVVWYCGTGGPYRVICRLRNSWSGCHLSPSASTASRSVNGMPDSPGGSYSHAESMQLMLVVLAVSAFSAISFYTGSSVLFGVYLAGLTLSYATQAPHMGPPRPRASPSRLERTYRLKISPLQDYLMAPMFFASIGFAIPFTALWEPRIIWRGVVYAMLMCVGKLATGIPIAVWSVYSARKARRATPDFTTTRPHVGENGSTDTFITAATQGWREHLAPALFMGIAMVARGEIGLLIAQIAHGDASALGLLSDDAFLICVWAILLCTLISPIGVGLLLRVWKGPAESR